MQTVQFNFKSNIMPCPSAQTKYFLSRTKDLVLRLKSTFFLVKWMENNILALEKKFFHSLKSFSILFLSKYELLSLGQKIFCLEQKMFCPGQF